MRQRSKVVDVGDMKHILRKLVQLAVCHRLARVRAFERRDLQPLLGIQRKVPALAISLIGVSRRPEGADAPGRRHESCSSRCCVPSQNRR